MTIDWKKYIDHIYCIHYVPYSDRRERLEKELKRVGILDSGIFSWQLSYDIPKFTKNPLEDNTYNHLQCYCNAKYMGYKKVMILEDDIVFLKDINMIQTLLDNLPNEYDICLFDHIFFKNDFYINDTHIDIFKYGEINKYYRYFYHVYLSSNYIICSTLYDTIINRILKDIIINEHLNPEDFYLSNFIKDNVKEDNYYNNEHTFIVNLFKYKSIISNKRMSIQHQYDNAPNLKHKFGKKLYINNTNEPIDIANKNILELPLNLEDYNTYEKE